MDKLGITKLIQAAIDADIRYTHSYRTEQAAWEAWQQNPCPDLAQVHALASAERHRLFELHWATRDLLRRWEDAEDTPEHQQAMALFDMARSIREERREWLHTRKQAAEGCDV